MNDQIKELAFDAGFIIKKNNGAEWRWGHIDPDLDKKLSQFAELIIEECMNSTRGAMTGLEAVNNIKEHFGVTG